MRNLDSCRCWRCTLRPCKVRNKCLVNFWNRTILMCILCVSPTNLNHNSVHVYSKYIIHRAVTLYNNLLFSSTLYLSVRHPFNFEFHKKYEFFNCGLIPTYCNCDCVLVLTTLKMSTRVAETCRWLLYNKLTFIHSSAFVGLYEFFFLHVTIFRWNVAGLCTSYVWNMWNLCFPPKLAQHVRVTA